MGAHQKIDRIARRNLRQLVKKRQYFPGVTEILHFEGRNGPDGIKNKSPGIDEPWHYIDPMKTDDHQALDLINDHIYNLTEALRAQNNVRAAFEAAWLAHSVVDCLTPAHHFPLADTIEELWGKPHTERQSIRDKNIIHGSSKRDTLRKNWRYWGAKGVFTTHFMFEFGFASTISALRFSDVEPDAADVKRVETEGAIPLLVEAVHEVYALRLYEEYYKKGWTRRLARQSREVLAPIIINLVTLSWYDAAYQAEQAAKKS